MSRLKNAPRVAWFVAGVCVAALLVPTTIGAVVALKYTGIEGSSTNKADVSPSGQLLTGEANPISYFSTYNPTSLGGNYALYVPPAGSAGVVRTIHLNVWGLSTADPFLSLYIGDATCANLVKNLDEVDPSASGVTVLPYDPGQIVPAGDALCAAPHYLYLDATTVGYTIPAASAPAIPLSPVQAAPRKG